MSVIKYTLIAIVGLIIVTLVIAKLRQYQTGDWFRKIGELSGTTNGEGGWFAENWKTVAQIVGGVFVCHLLVGYFWPKVWWMLATNLIFWVDHLVIVLVFLCFRKDKEVKGKTIKEISGVGTAILLILFCGNVFVIGNWYAEKSEKEEKIAGEQRHLQEVLRRQANTKKMFAPVGEWSEPIKRGRDGKIGEIDSLGKIWIRTSDEMRPFLYDPKHDGRVGWGRPKWVEVKSGEKEPVEITITK